MFHFYTGCTVWRLCHSMEHFLIHVALTHQSGWQHSVTWRPQCTHPLSTEAENGYCLACFLPITHIHDGLGKVCPSTETRIRCSPALDIVLVSRLTLFQAAKSRYIAFGLWSLCSGRYHLLFQINKTLSRRFLILPGRIMIVIMCKRCM